MIVTDMPVETLVPYARNPRNNTAAIDAVKASIAEFGFRQPIVVDEKMVVISTPRLKVSSASGTSACGRPIWRSAPAKPRPCRRQKPKTTIQGYS